MRFFRTLAALLAIAGCSTAHAFCNPSYNLNTTVTGEFYDAGSDRFYLAWSSPTSFGGCFPPTLSQAPPEGTTSTALTLTTAAHDLGCNTADPSHCALSRRVCEFEVVGQPAPASRFYTIDAEECEALKRPGSGWTYLPMTTAGETGGPSLAAFAVEPSTHQCHPGLVPVYRFLKTSGRGPLNHRYVADEQVVEQMRARAGWTFERIAFCVLGARRNSLGTFAPGFQFMEAPGPPAPCDNGVGRVQTCIESDHMPALLDLRTVSGADSAFASKSGAFYSSGYVHTLPFLTLEEAATHSFAQTSGTAPGAGFFVTSRDRLSGSAASLRGRTEVVGTQMPAPFLASYEVEMDLVLEYRLFVKRARVTGEGAGAYVQPLVTLRDVRSGLAMELSPGRSGLRT
jgi:hypothetical protein